MSIDAITKTTVRDALRAIRYARPMGDSPLLGLDLVSLRLRDDGLADTRQSRAYALQRCLEAAVDERLVELRGEVAESRAADDSPEPELERLRQDLRSDSAVRLDWALLHARYLSIRPISMARISDALGVTERTVHHWVARGMGALMRELQEREAAATRQLASAHDLHAYDRIQVTEDAEPRTVVELLGEMVAA